MIPEIGQFAFILALAVGIVLAILPQIGAARGIPQLVAVAKPAAQVQFLFVLIAFACLGYSFINNDFSVLNVATNSNSRLPLHYRLAATWGSHEGSLLLWAFMLTLWMAAVTLFSKHLPEKVVARVLAIMATISVGFLLFMLLTSNPFQRLIPAAADGRDLNPLLQDPAMVAHPPMLYMGYVGFSVVFAFAIAALIGGRLDATWARWSRPWTTVAWMFLTCGIALGSFWAYYELGWGGWWFWDPVENASFMPWLVGTALIHSLAVTEKRGGFKSWTVLTGDRGVFVEPARHVSGSLRRAYFRSRVRERSEARRFHSRISHASHRRLTRSLCVARAAGWTGREVRFALARIAFADEQRSADGCLRLSSARHFVSAVHGRAQPRQDFRRPAVLQRGVRAADGARDVSDWRRTDRAMETGEAA